MTRTQAVPENQPSSYQDPEFQIQPTSIDHSGENGERRKKVHITLQGKGGIGKSFVSFVLAQYLNQYDPDLLCLDTDPVNATLSSFPALRARTIALLEGNNTINERRFDDMMEQIEEALQSDTFFLMSKQRIKIVQRSIYEQLEAAI